MLVLSRKPAESIDLFLGGLFVGRVTVAELQTGKVRLAIEAVEELRVVRTEITDCSVAGARKEEFQVA